MLDRPALFMILRVATELFYIFTVPRLSFLPVLLALAIGDLHALQVATEEQKGESKTYEDKINGNHENYEEQFEKVSSNVAMWRLTGKGKGKEKEKEKGIRSSIDRPTSSPLPLEVVMEILSFLPVRDVANAALVCQTWNVAAMDETIWKRLFKEAQARQQAQRPKTRGLITQSWRQRFKETFHVKQRFLFGPSSNLELHLDSTILVLENDDDAPLVTGEIVLNLYPVQTTIHGIYLCLEVIEHVPSKGKGTSYHAIKLMEQNWPVGDFSPIWGTPSTEPLDFNRGTFRFPFSFELLPAANRLPPSFDRSTMYGRFVVEYKLHAVALRRSFLLGDLSTSIQTIQVKRSPDYEAALVDQNFSNPFTSTITQAHPYMLSATVTLPKSVYRLGEWIPLHIDVDSGLWSTKGIQVILYESIGSVVNGMVTLTHGMGFNNKNSRKYMFKLKAKETGSCDIKYPLRLAEVPGTTIVFTQQIRNQFTLQVKVVRPFGIPNVVIEIPLCILSETDEVSELDDFVEVGDGDWEEEEARSKYDYGLTSGRDRDSEDEEEDGRGVKSRSDDALDRTREEGGDDEAGLKGDSGLKHEAQDAKDEPAAQSDQLEQTSSE